MSAPTDDLGALAKEWRQQSELLRQSVSGHSRKHDPHGSIDRNLAMANLLDRHATAIESHQCASSADHEVVP